MCNIKHYLALSGLAVFLSVVTQGVAWANIFRPFGAKEGEQPSPPSILRGRLYIRIKCYKIKMPLSC